MRVEDRPGMKIVTPTRLRQMQRDYAEHKDHNPEECPTAAVYWVIEELMFRRNDGAPETLERITCPVCQGKCGPAHPCGHCRNRGWLPAPPRFSALSAEDVDPDYVFGLNQLASRIAFTNREKGFGDPSLENIDRKLLLAVSEICEAQDVLRDGHAPDSVFWHPKDPNRTSGPVGSIENGDKPDGFPIELADAIIRLLHICSALNIDIAAAVALKVKYNRTRPEKHGRIF